MKQLFIAALISVVCVVTSAAEEEAVWSTAVATRPSDGHRIIYRYRSEFGPSFKRSTYSDRVIISWSYKSESGMPTSAERISMDRMENLLAPYVEQKAFAILALVSTGEGLREWVYYTKSQTEFMAKLNEALHGQPKFPVEVHLWKDPEWSRYEEFRRNVKQ